MPNDTTSRLERMLARDESSEFCHRDDAARELLICLNQAREAQQSWVGARTKLEQVLKRHGLSPDVRVTERE